MQSFIDVTARTLSAVENNEARHYMSVSDASTSTWIGCDSQSRSAYPTTHKAGTWPRSWISSICHDMRGASSLDDVDADALHGLLPARPRIHHRGSDWRHQPHHRDSYERFFSRYISGTEVPPYKTILAYAGYHLETGTRRSFDLGVGL
jgi:predicted metalloprotease with PDZ domain